MAEGIISRRVSPFLPGADISATIDETFNLGKNDLVEIQPVMIPTRSKHIINTDYAMNTINNSNYRFINVATNDKYLVVAECYTNTICYLVLYNRNTGAKIASSTAPFDYTTVSNDYTIQMEIIGNELCVFYVDSYPKVAFYDLTDTAITSKKNVYIYNSYNDYSGRPQIIKESDTSYLVVYYHNYSSSNSNYFSVGRITLTTDGLFSDYSARSIKSIGYPQLNNMSSNTNSSNTVTSHRKAGFFIDTNSNNENIFLIVAQMNSSNTINDLPTIGLTSGIFSFDNTTVTTTVNKAYHYNQPVAPGYFVELHRGHIDSDTGMPVYYLITNTLSTNAAATDGSIHNGEYIITKLVYQNNNMDWYVEEVGRFPVFLPDLTQINDVGTTCVSQGNFDFIHIFKQTNGAKILLQSLAVAFGSNFKTKTSFYETLLPAGSGATNWAYTSYINKTYNNISVAPDGKIYYPCWSICATANTANFCIHEFTPAYTYGIKNAKSQADGYIVSKDSNTAVVHVFNESLIM